MTNEKSNSDGENSATRRINARLISKLRAVYKGAEKRVKTLSFQLANIKTQLRNGYKIVPTNGVKKHVKFTFPELEHLRDRRNLIQLELDKAREDVKTSKAVYAVAAKSNKNCSAQLLQSTRKAKDEKKQAEILSLVKDILACDSQNGKRDEVISLKDVAESDNAVDFRNNLKILTGIYIPVKLNLSEIQEGLKNWSPGDSNRLIFGE